jgi:hypothetical protein
MDTLFLYLVPISGLLVLFLNKSHFLCKNLTLIGSISQKFNSPLELIFTLINNNFRIVNKIKYLFHETHMLECSTYVRKFVSRHEMTFLVRCAENKNNALKEPSIKIVMS